MVNYIKNKKRDTGVETKIRTKADALGIRVQEPFLDYDRLRSGYVTCKILAFISLHN